MAVLSCVPGISYLTQAHAATSHDARSAVFVSKTTKTLESSIAQLENPLFREFSEGSMLVQPYSTSCWPNEKWCLVNSCYFQAISGVFLRSSGARLYGEVLHASAGGCALAFIQRHVCWRSCQPLWRAGTTLAHGTHPTSSCAARAPHLQLSGLPQYWWAVCSWAGAGGA